MQATVGKRAAMALTSRPHRAHLVGPQDIVERAAREA